MNNEQQPANPLSICNPDGVLHLLPPIKLNAHQLRNALDFVNPDGANDPDQLDSALCIQWRKETVVDGEHHPAGYCAWFEEYPEEGSILLDDKKSTITHPPQYTPLTNIEIVDLRHKHGVTSNGRGIRELTQVIDFVRAIESRMKNARHN